MRNRVRWTIVVALLLLAVQAFASDAIAAYRSGTNQSFCTAATATNCPKIRFWNSTGAGAWGPEIELPSASSPIREIVVKQSPVSSKIVMVTESDDGFLDAYVCPQNCTNASNWVFSGNIGQVWSSAPLVSSRRFDVEFETATGNALVVYAVPSSGNASRDLAYKVLPPGPLSFSGITERYIDDGNEASPVNYTWISLDRKPVNTSSELILAGFDGTNNDVNAWVWNGSAWGNQQELATSATNTGGFEDLAVKYASDGSKSMVVAGGLSGGGNANRDVSWMFWNGTNWSALFNISHFTTTNGVVPKWMSMKADPASPALQLVVVDNRNTGGLDTAYWNGSAWALTTNIVTNLDSFTTRPADFAWEPTGSTGRLVFDNDPIGSTFGQRLCNPQCNTSTTIISNFTGANWLAMYTDPTSTDSVRILGITVNMTRSIGVFSWNGTAYSNYGSGVLTDSNPNATTRGFSLAFLPSNVSFDFTPPAVSLNSPANNSLLNTSTVGFNFTATDIDSAAVNCTVFVDNAASASNSSTQNSTPTVVSVIGISDGNHNWSVSCQDNSSNSGSSPTWSFTVDTTPPAVTLNSPVNALNTSSTSLNFNFTAADNIASTMNCSLFIDGVQNSTNASTSNNTATIFPVSGISQGNHNWSVQCKDTAGNTGNSVTRTFTVDTTPPAVTLNSPVDTFNSSSSTINFNFTAADNLATSMNCSLFIDGLLNRTNASTANNTPTNLSISGLAQGTHSWNVSCTDPSGNTGNSPIRAFTVDTTPPVVTLNSPVNSFNSSSSTVAFNYTAADNLAATMNCSLFIDGVSSAANSSTANNTPTILSVSGIPQGAHSWNVTCMDNANNAGLSATRTFIVDITPPVVTLNSPVNALNTSSTTINFNFTAADNLATAMSCSLLIDSVLNRTNASTANNTPTNFSVGGLAQGAHSWSVICTDPSGNFGSSLTRTFTIDTTPPTVTLNSPPNGSVINTPGVNLSFTPSDNLSPTANCSLSVDGILSGTNTSAANNTLATIPVGGLQMGNHTWNVTCKDNSGNVGASATWNFFVTAVSSCPVITVPGSYVQVTNLLGAPNGVSPPPQSGFSSVCVKIAASNTVYDCGGFNITNNGVNNAMGIYVNGSLTNVTIRNCGVSQYKQGGLVFQTTASSVVNSSFFNNSQAGLFADTSSGLTLLGDSAFSNGQDGIGISGGGNNTIVNNTLTGNKQSGIDLLNSPDNNFTGNNATGNTVEGIHVASSDNNLFSGNNVSGNKQDGIQVVTNTNNTFINNLADNNTQHGLHISNTVTNIFINNTMDFNSQDGLLSASSNASSFFSNTACFNGQSGFLFASSTVDQMVNNTACSNAQNGIFIDDSNLTTLSGNHYYNNTLDFTMTSGATKIVNTTNEIFDNPLDGLQNYTNLSVNDTEAFSTYSISWSPRPAALPPGCPTFGNKFVNITNSSGNVSIDSITWFWQPNETAGLTPSFFHLAVYNGSGWTAVNGQTANLATDSINVVNLTQFGVVGILMCNDSASALKLNQTAFLPSPGGVVQFNITINDTGNTTLNPLEAVDTLPAGLTYLSASPAPSSVIGQAITWDNAGPIAPGSVVVLYVNASVDPGTVSASTPLVTLTNNVSAVGTDPINLNVTANSSANVTIYYANVSIIKLNQTALQPSPGGIVQFNMTATNTGNVTLSPTQMIDVLPAGLTFSSASVAPDSVAGQTVTWNDLGSLGPGVSAVVYLNATVDAGTVNASAPAVTLANCANTTGTPPNGFDVSAISCANVSIFYANVSVVKVDITPVLTSPGGTVQWQINVSNPGQLALDPLTVVDQLPMGFQFSASAPSPGSVSPDNRTIAWSVGPLPSGGSAVILLNSSVSANVANGTYANSVSATGTPPNGANVTSSDTADVGIFAPAINIVKSVNQSIAGINQNVNFTLNVSNTGSVNETVTILDALPANITLMSSDVPPTSNSSGIVIWANVTDLAPGASFAIHYVARASANGTYFNNATATGSPPNGNNVTDNSTATLLINPAPVNPPHGGGGNDLFNLAYSFVCPGNGVVFNATQGSTPVPGVSIRVIYDTPPAYYTAANVTTGASGTASTTLSSNGTYDIFAGSGNLVPVHEVLDFTTCPPVLQCANDSQCGGGEQCVGGSCRPLQCSCGQSAQNHACVGTQWQCGGGPECPSCPSGLSCGSDHSCYQCVNDSDCSGTQYCDIPAGSKGGTCKEITACGLVANHTVVQPYECGLPSCPACPSGELCEEHSCVSYNLTGPNQGIVGQNATLVASRNGLACAGCSLSITLPDGTVLSVSTDPQGRFTLPLNMAGMYDVTLTQGGAMMPLQVTAVEAAQPPIPPRPASIYDNLWLVLLLALLLLALLYLLWRGRITIYSEPGAIGPNSVALSQGLLDSKDLKSGDTVSLQLGKSKISARVVAMPGPLSLANSKAKGEGNFILAGEGVLKALKIKPAGQRDTSGAGFESFAQVRGLKINPVK